MDYDTDCRQILLGVLASCSQISSGMTLAFPSVALPAMSESIGANSTSNHDFDQSFWIVSLPQISMVIGCLTAGPILDWKGRRFGILLQNLVALSGWFLMAVLPDLWSILLSRLMTGFAMGFSNPAVLVFISEISSPQLRSSLSVINSITFSLGVTLTFVFGYFFRVNWRTVSWLCGLFPATCLVIMLFVLPEPKLRRAKGKFKKGMFLTPEVYKPMCIMHMALTFRSLCGVSVILSYTVEMIKQASVSLDPYLVSILVGVCRTLGGVATVWVSSQLGRRHPAIWSGLSMSCCMLALASSFQLPTLALLAFILTSTIHASVTQSMSAEVFPTDVRGVATSVAAVNTFTTGFLALWIHQFIKNDSRLMFLYYGIMGAGSTLFLFIFLPETHNKTLTDIQRIFNKNIPVEEPEVFSPLDPAKQPTIINTRSLPN